MADVSQSRSDAQAFVIWATTGMYEPSTWLVCAYPTQALADAEAARMNKAFAEFWKTRKDDLGEGPSLALPDAELEKAYVEYDARRDALLAKWRPLIGDDHIDEWDETTYTVGTLKLCGFAPRSERGTLDDPFCWYRVTRDITDEYVTVYSEAENCPGPDWKPLYER